MNTKQMQAALAKINPKTAKASAKADDREPLLVRTAATLGAAIPVARANVGTFTSAFATSYRYHDAVRKGQL